MMQPLPALSQAYSLLLQEESHHETLTTGLVIDSVAMNVKLSNNTGLMFHFLRKIVLKFMNTVKILVIVKRNASSFMVILSDTACLASRTLNSSNLLPQMEKGC